MKPKGINKSLIFATLGLMIGIRMSVSAAGGFSCPLVDPTASSGTLKSESAGKTNPRTAEQTEKDAKLVDEILIKLKAKIDHILASQSTEEIHESLQMAACVIPYEKSGYVGEILLPVAEKYPANIKSELKLLPLKKASLLEHDIKGAKAQLKNNGNG